MSDNGDQGVVHLGGCFCGNIRYQVSGRPVEVPTCHCSMCRKTSGSPFVTWAIFPADRFTFTQGTLSILKSSAVADRGFCNQCGTPLTYHELKLPEFVGLTVGSFDNPDVIEPQDHIFYADKVKWLELVDNLPRHSELNPVDTRAPFRAQTAAV